MKLFSGFLKHFFSEINQTKSQKCFKNSLKFIKIQIKFLQLKKNKFRTISLELPPNINKFQTSKNAKNSRKSSCSRTAPWKPEICCLGINAERRRVVKVTGE